MRLEIHDFHVLLLTYWIFGLKEKIVVNKNWVERKFV